MPFLPARPLGRPGLITAWAALAAVFSAPSSCAPLPRAGPEPQRFYSALRLTPVGPVPYQADTLPGRVVLVRFFATWCFPCLADLPVLQRLWEERSGQGFTVVLVGMDLEGERVLEPFAERYALPFPVLVADAEIRQGQSPFGTVSALPTSVLFGREGEVLLAYAGVAEPASLLRAVEAAVRR